MKIVVNAPTVDEAVKEGARQLGCEVHELEVKILEAPRLPILGLGGRDAVVELEGPEPKEESSPYEGEHKEIYDLLMGLFEAMGLSVSLVLEEEDKALRGRMDADDRTLRRLIGREGRSLDALERILRQMLRRQGIHQRVYLDAADYRIREEQKVEEKAKALAEKAIRLQKPIHMPPQHPRKRRVVHRVLEANPLVTSESEGEGSARHVVIRPVANDEKEPS